MKGRLLQRKNVETPTEVPKHDASVQVSGCSECQSLALAVQGGRDDICVRCDQLDDLLFLMVDLKEEVERLRSIRDCRWSLGGPGQGLTLCTHVHTHAHTAQGGFSAC